MRAGARRMSESKIFSLRKRKTELPLAEMRNTTEGETMTAMTININGLNSLVKRGNGFNHLTHSDTIVFLI